LASAQTTSHLPALDTPERTEVGDQLQDVLVELVDLSLVGKQLHWCVVGPHFRSLHLFLDEMVDSWRELSDTVAERAVALGSFPDGQAAAIAAREDSPSLERGPISDQGVIRELANRLAEACERIRVRMDRLEALDAASQDVLVEVIRALEEQLWMIRAQLPASVPE
jgi:starvation-inducible DNA-binding protein